MIKPREIMVKLRTSFWFVPLLFVLLIMGLAITFIEIDSRLSVDLSELSPRLFGVGAEGARGMLSTIAGSIMTMMGITFSMTLVTLALASSQYSSRILRNFIRNRLTQSALGILAAIFVYCLMVLRTIRGGETTFIPNLSIFFGFIFALVGVAVLVLFIHHVATSIQASSIISSVAEETIEGIKKLFPDELGQELSEDLVSPEPPVDAEVRLANCSGYIQTIDEKPLREFSSKVKAKVWVNSRIGEFIVKGTPMVFYKSQNPVSRDTLKCLEKAFSVQSYRTIEQDVLFGVRQLVDIALKALSPGVNDTTTAILCIDYLTSILSHLVDRQIPSPVREMGEGTLIIVKQPLFKDYLQEAFSQIRSDGRGNFAVQERLLWSYRTLSSITTNGQRREFIGEEVSRLNEIISETFDLNSEKSKLASKFIETNRAMLS